MELGVSLNLLLPEFIFYNKNIKVFTDVRKK